MDYEQQERAIRAEMAMDKTIDQFKQEIIDELNKIDAIYISNHPFAINKSLIAREEAIEIIKNK